MRNSLNTAKKFLKERQPERRNGAALVVVLWVITLLSIFVLTFAFDMHIQARITSTWRKKLKAEYIARGGMEIAKMALLETANPDVRTPEISGYTEMGSDKARRLATVSLSQGGGADFEEQIGEGVATISIRPENAKINLNSIIDLKNEPLTKALWDPLLEQAGVPFDVRDSLVDCVMDWVDQNELSHLNGAESDYYETLNPPYQAKNAPFDTVDELLLVKGFADLIPQSTQTVYEAISRYLTAFADERKININAVDPDTLMAFLGIDEELALTILAGRAGIDMEPGTTDDQPYKDFNDLSSRVPGITPDMAEYITFSAAGRFYIHVVGKVGDITRSIACVASLSKKDIVVLTWLEGDAVSMEMMAR
jgi:general secretion pathway protein K